MGSYNTTEVNASANSKHPYKASQSRECPLDRIAGPQIRAYRAHLRSQAGNLVPSRIENWQATLAEIRDFDRWLAGHLERCRSCLTRYARAVEISA